MIEITHFQRHLQHLRASDWAQLFSLLPEIERTQKFGEIEGAQTQADGSLIMPYWNSGEIVDTTMKLINQLQLYPIFDWVNWKEGQSMLSEKNLSFSELDIEILCKLLTIIIRKDRFQDGFLISCFKTGLMYNILKGIQNQVQKTN
ncbi:hypothetical protein BH10BAC3_BH10BAC3_12140 [soil metagenome]